jgi:hypothetical protein
MAAKTQNKTINRPTKPTGELKILPTDPNLDRH